MTPRENRLQLLKEMDCEAKKSTKITRRDANRSVLMVHDNFVPLEQGPLGGRRRFFRAKIGTNRQDRLKRPK